MVQYLPYRVLLLFYCILKVIATSGIISHYNGVEVTGNASWVTDDFNVQQERNITLRGEEYTGHKRKPTYRKILPDPPAYDPTLPMFKECDECADGYCEREGEEGTLKKIAKAVIRNNEARTAHILSLARKRCREHGFMGQIEIAGSACFKGSSLSTGAWTQLGDQIPIAHEDFPGSGINRVKSVDDLEQPKYDDILTEQAYATVDKIIQLMLLDMAERAAVWQDPEVFAHAAMDRSALTRKLVIADPFVGLFEVSLYFRLWLHNFAEKHSEPKNQRGGRGTRKRKRSADSKQSAGIRRRRGSGGHVEE